MADVAVGAARRAHAPGLSLMARATGFSAARIHRWWRAAGIQPHRVRTFKLSNDPHFEAKLRDVIAVLAKKRSPAS